MISNMDIIGKRPPTAANYDVGVDDNGLIQYLVYDYYFDYGAGGNVFMATLALPASFNCYNSNNFFITAHNVRTDKYASTWCRAPGKTQHRIRHYGIESNSFCRFSEGLCDD